MCSKVDGVMVFWFVYFVVVQEILDFMVCYVDMVVVVYVFYELCLIDCY